MLFTKKNQSKKRILQFGKFYFDLIWPQRDFILSHMDDSVAIDRSLLEYAIKGTLCYKLWLLSAMAESGNHKSKKMLPLIPPHDNSSIYFTIRKWY